jgi:hypothetical protein
MKKKPSKNKSGNHIKVFWAFDMIVKYTILFKITSQSNRSLPQIVFELCETTLPLILHPYSLLLLALKSPDVVGLDDVSPLICEHLICGGVVGRAPPRPLRLALLVPECFQAE